MGLRVGENKELKVLEVVIRLKDRHNINNIMREVRAHRFKIGNGS